MQTLIRFRALFQLRSQTMLLAPLFGLHFGSSQVSRAHSNVNIAFGPVQCIVCTDPKSRPQRQTAKEALENGKLTVVSSPAAANDDDDDNDTVAHASTFV